MKPNALVLLSCALVLGGARAVGEAPGLEALLPANTTLLVTVDVDRLLVEGRSLDVVRMLDDDEIAAFLEPVGDAMRPATSRLRGLLALMHSYGVPDTIAGRVQLGIVGFGRQYNEGPWHWTADGAIPPPPPPVETADGIESSTTGMPDFVLRIETSGRAAFESAFTRALELAGGAAGTVREEGGVAFAETTVSPEADVVLPLAYGFDGDVFFAAARTETLIGALEAATGAGPQPEPLATSEDFSAWRAAAGTLVPVVDLFLSIGAGEGDAGARLPEPFMHALEVLRPARAAGLRVTFEEGRIHERAVVLSPGTWRSKMFLGDLLDTFEVPRGAAGDAALFATFDADPERLGDLLDHHPEIAGVFQALAGLDLRADLLAHLGGRTTVRSWVPRAVTFPDLLIEAGLADAEAFRAALEGARDRLRAAPANARAPQIQVKDLEVEGATGFVLSAPRSPYQFTFAVAQDRAFIASSPRVLQERGLAPGAAAATPSTQATPATPATKENADFRRCFDTVIAGGRADQTAAIVYVDLDAILTFLLPLAEQFLPMVAHELPVQLDAAMIPLAETVTEYVSGYMLAIRSGDGFIAFDAVSPAGGPVVSFLAGVAAGMTQNSR